MFGNIITVSQVQTHTGRRRRWCWDRPDGETEVKSWEQPPTPPLQTLCCFSLPVAWQPNVTAPLPVIDQQRLWACSPTIPCWLKESSNPQPSGHSPYRFDYIRKGRGQAMTLCSQWNLMHSLYCTHVCIVVWGSYSTTECTFSLYCVQHLLQSVVWLCNEPWKYFYTWIGWPFRWEHRASSCPWLISASPKESLFSSTAHSRGYKVQLIQTGSTGGV